MFSRLVSKDEGDQNAVRHCLVDNSLSMFCRGVCADDVPNALRRKKTSLGTLGENNRDQMRASRSERRVAVGDVAGSAGSSRRGREKCGNRERPELTIGSCGDIQ